MTTSSNNVKNLIKEIKKERPIDEYGNLLLPRTKEQL